MRPSSGGLAAHAFQFLNANFSHDSIDRIYTGSTEIQNKIVLGHFLVPLYRFLFRGRLETPWIIGLMALIWLALSVYLVVHLIGGKKKSQIVLTAGVMVVNITIIAQTATYLYELDGNMLGLLFAVLCAVLWHSARTHLQASKWFVLIPLLLASICGAASMALYQSYIAVSVTLMVLLSLLDLVDGLHPKRILQNGLLAIGVLLVSGGIYLVSLKLVLSTLKLTALTGYNSVMNVADFRLTELPRLFLRANRIYFSAFLHPASTWLPKTLSSAIQYGVWGLILYGAIRSIAKIKGGVAASCCLLRCSFFCRSR